MTEGESIVHTPKHCHKCGRELRGMVIKYSIHDGTPEFGLQCRVIDTFSIGGHNVVWEMLPLGWLLVRDEGDMY